MSISALTKFELHGFREASTCVYAAVVCVKTLSDPVTVTVVAAKIRISLHHCGYLAPFAFSLAKELSIAEPAEVLNQKSTQFGR